MSWLLKIKKVVVRLFYYENRRSVMRNRPSAILGRNNLPNEHVICYLLQNFETICLLTNQVFCINIKVVHEKRNTSIYGIWIFPTVQLKEFYKGVHLMAYKIQLTQELEESSRQKIHIFVNLGIRGNIDADFYKWRWICYSRKKQCI